MIQQGDYIIARSTNAGVFAGTLANRDGEEVTLTDARRLWYWDGASSLSELSQLGPSKPANCKFPATVPEVLVLGVCELLPVSDDARAALEAVKVWSQH